MPAFFFPRRLLSIGGISRTLLLACVAAILGIVGGRVAISHYGTPAIELLIAVPLLILLTSRPFPACIVLLGLLGSMFAYGDLPRANVPGHPPLNVADVLLAVVVGSTIWRKPWRTWPRPVRSYALVLLLLLALASVSTIRLALLGHDPARSAILGFRNLLYLALPLTIALELSGRLWRPLLNGAIALAALVSIISIAAVASGSVAHFVTSFNATAVMNISSSGSLGSATRVRLPGLFLAYAMCIPTLVMILTVKDRWRPLRIGALLLMIVAIAVSLNRNMYFGGAVGLLVAVLIGGSQLRYRVILTAAVAVACTVLVVESVKPAATTEIAQRAGSALSSQVLSSGSAQARALEFHFAFLSISRHPLDGVGWLQDYGLDSGTGSGPRVFVEDLYIHMATDYGVPAAIAFLLVPGFLLLYGIRRASSAANPIDRAVLAGAVGALVALLLSCLVGTYLQSPDSTASFAAVCGLVLGAGLRATPRPRTEMRSRARGRVTSDPAPPDRDAVASRRRPTGGMTRTSPVLGARPLRVVVTCDWFLKYAAAQAAALARTGAGVALLCRTHANEFGGDARERASALQFARDAGVELLEIPGRLSDPRVARSLIRIRRQLSGIRPDVVHAHDGADPRALALLRGIPTVLTVHDPAPHPGHPVPGARKRWFLDGSRAAWRARARIIVIHSEPLRHELQLSAGQRSVVMPHGLDLLDEPLSPPGEPVVSFFGRLTPYKGLEVLARAMPRVWQARPEIRLRVAGAGTSTLDLQDSRVQVERTYLPEARLEDFFGQTSLALLPYTQASQTGAGSLAVGFGVPVVVSRVGGLPDLALDETYIFDPGDDAGLAAAILRHVDDGAAVRQRVLSEVAAPRSWDSVAQCSIDLYRELCAA